MKKPVIVAVALLAAVVVTAGAREPVRPYEGSADLTPQGKIDELVFAKLKELGIQPARFAQMPCSSAAFTWMSLARCPLRKRRKHLLTTRIPKKRSVLIDRLLERKEFADYWAMKWSDLLRVRSEFPINLWPNAVQAYHHWIRTSIKDNVPYDRFVREMLTASGSNFRVPQVNFYRALQSKEPQAIAQAVALTFMGIRPESWTKESWAGMGGFFSQITYKHTEEWKEEIICFLPGSRSHAERGNEDKAVKAIFPDGTSVQLLPDKDPREVFADWLIDPNNPWFTRAIANRVWCWLLGRGIIHQPDDIRPGNPPSNPELLAYLERELVASHYDLKQLYRLILNSKTYQLSSIPASDDPRAAAQFAHYTVRRLDAEVLIDALCQITGTTENYSSPIPEPFTYIPEAQRSIALADASITSPFLEMFGRPARESGLESDRNNRTTADQRLHMLNSSHIRRKLEQSPRFRNSGTGSEQAGRGIECLVPAYPVAVPDSRGVEDYWGVCPIRGREKASGPGRCLGLGQ